MKVGDLVKMNQGYSEPGFVLRIDKQHYGSSTAYKISKVERGKCIRSNMVDFIGVTADGIRDRVLVLWPDAGYSYEESTKLEVISESR
jgi:hypothetical protein